MSELDDKLDDEREQLRQKSLKYGYKSLTKEEKIQVEYYIQDEVYQEQKELDDVYISNDYNKNKLQNRNIKKSAYRKNDILKNLHNELEKLQSYHITKFIRLAIVWIFLYAITSIIAILGTMAILSGAWLAGVEFYFIPYVGVVVVTIIFVIYKIYNKRGPNWIFQSICIKDNKLFFCFHKRYSVFADGKNYVIIRKNKTNLKCYDLGCDAYQQDYKRFDIKSIYATNSIKTNVHKNDIQFGYNEGRHKKITLTTDKYFVVKELRYTDHRYLGNDSAYATRHENYFIKPFLINNKFYLPTPLKAYLEKKGVDYLNDSRIEFVDNIYEVLRQERKREKEVKRYGR